MLQKIINFLDKKEIPLSGEGLTLHREPLSHFFYDIEEDWFDSPTFFTAMDHDGIPIVFPGSEVGVSGQTKEEVRSRMLDAYPNAEERKKE